MNLTEKQHFNDLRAAVYHEAGHKYVCNRFGGDGDIFISPNQSGASDERAWCGQFRHVRAPDGLYDHSGHRVGTLPGNWEVLVGMAGLIAEELLHGETEFADQIWQNLEFKIIDGEASDSDLASMGISNTLDFELNFDDVKQVVAYLVEGWTLVQKEVEYQIAEALTTSSGDSITAS